MQPTDIFEKKESRADFTYIPKVKDLKDVMCLPDLSEPEGRELLSKIISSYEEKLD